MRITLETTSHFQTATSMIRDSDRVPQHIAQHIEIPRPSVDLRDVTALDLTRNQRRILGLFILLIPEKRRELSNGSFLQPLLHWAKTLSDGEIDVLETPTSSIEEKACRGTLLIAYQGKDTQSWTPTINHL